MPRYRFSKFFSLIFILADLACLNASLLLANLINFEYFVIESGSSFMVFLGTNLIWISVFFSGNLQTIDRESTFYDHLSRWFAAYVVNLCIVFILWILIEPLYYSKHQLFYTYLIFPMLSVSWLYVWSLLIGYYRAFGYNLRTVVVAGLDGVSEQLVNYIQSQPRLGYRFHGFFDNSKSTHDNFGGDLRYLKEYVLTNRIDIIYCNLNRLTERQVKDLIDFAENHLIKVSLLSNQLELVRHRSSIYNFGDVSVVNLSSIPLDDKINRIIKRLFDIVFSSLVILSILSWVIPLIGTMIRVESKGPVFFRQRRNGLNNRPFLIYKFRSMVVHEDRSVKQASKNDSRITRLGAFLRKTSIDELPQFINVFLGEMSVVGPRPHAVKHNMEFKKVIDRFIQRHAVKPGITGLAQSRGFRGETTTLASIAARVRLDRFYVRNWSLLLDFKIIFWTIRSLIKGNENAY